MARTKTMMVVFGGDGGCEVSDGGDNIHDSADDARG